MTPAAGPLGPWGVRNEYALEFFGYTSNEIVSKSVLDLIVPETDTSGRDLREMIEDRRARDGRFQRSTMLLAPCTSAVRTPHNSRQHGTSTCPTFDPGRGGYIHLQSDEPAAGMHSASNVHGTPTLKHVPVQTFVGIGVWIGVGGDANGVGVPPIHNPSCFFAGTQSSYGPFKARLSGPS